jgi:hypothetical protein
VQETDPAGQHAVTAGAGRRTRASPGAAASVCAVLSAGLVLALFLANLVLIGLTRDLTASFSGALPVGGLLFTGLGLVIARRQNERDYQAFTAAVAAGRLPAQTGV